MAEPAGPGGGDAFDALLSAANDARNARDLATAGMLYERVMRLRPEDPDALYNFGLHLIACGEGERACLLLNAAFAKNPGNFKLAAALGHALRATDRYAFAEMLWRSLATVMPDQPQPYYELGQALLGLARPEDAVDAFRTALRYSSVAAERDLNWKAYLLALAYADGVDPLLVRDENRRRAAELAPASVVHGYANGREPERRLRIGYISSDFRGHSVARTMEALFVHRDRARFEIFAYAEDNRPDAVTQRFRELADSWRSTAGKSDAAVADAIRSDRIDVLVLSAAHFDENRLGIALHRPAPVQVSIYDSASTGSDAFDAFVIDPAMAGGGADHLSERAFRLRSMYVHPPLEFAPPVSPAPAAANGFVTFGSANHPSKFSKRTFALWAAALRAVPDARLRLKSARRYEDPAMREILSKRFAELGVAPERLIFDQGDFGLAAHLSFYGRIDVSLDTTPFNGATTTFESLWMGVPVVALAGTTIMSRWAFAVLSRIGRPEWAATDEAGFASVAAGLARAAASQDRAALRAAVQHSSLCDLPRHARDYERLYRTLWRRWCRKTA
ncbi:MAG: hypothetical protein HY059_14675 [Proteobacteria bacterium]|nr:hypothetical protein [Pseudomonadota bacterium]